MRLILVMLAFTLGLTLVGCGKTCACVTVGGYLWVSGPQTQAEDAGATVFDVALGSSAIGQQAVSKVAFINQSQSPVSIVAVASPTDAQFTFPLADADIQPGEEIDVDVGFTPHTLGTKTATVVIETDSSSMPTLTLNLTGTGMN